MKGYTAFRELLRQGLLPPEASKIRDEDEQANIHVAQYQEVMWNVCKYHSLFVTAPGYFGLGPHYMREGDAVAILYGLQFTAILRPADDNYISFGTAYLHSIMYGEAVRKHEATSAEDDTFRIQ